MAGLDIERDGISCLPCSALLSATRTRWKTVLFSSPVNGRTSAVGDILGACLNRLTLTVDRRFHLAFSSSGTGGSLFHLLTIPAGSGHAERHFAPRLLYWDLNNISTSYVVVSGVCRSESLTRRTDFGILDLILQLSQSVCSPVARSENNLTRLSTPLDENIDIWNTW